MVGGGSVYLSARSIDFAKKYWINDDFRDLVAFWKIAQSAKECSRLRADLEKLRSNFRNSEEIKEYFYKAREESSVDDYRTALLFFFFNRVTFSGTTRAGGFSSQASINRFTKSSIERLAGLPSALDSTKITSGDFESVIKQPGKDVFIFLDPPYYTAKRLYGHNGSLHQFDHKRLATILERSKHRFLITYDDCAEIRELYGWANIYEWRLQYGMNNCSENNASKIGQELFICNYKP